MTKTIAVFVVSAAARACFNSGNQNFRSTPFLLGRTYDTLHIILGVMFITYPLPASVTHIEIPFCISLRFGQCIVKALRKIYAGSDVSVAQVAVKGKGKAAFGFMCFIPLGKYSVHFSSFLSAFF